MLMPSVQNVSSSALETSEPAVGAGPVTRSGVPAPPSSTKRSSASSPLLGGGETMFVLRDLCRLSQDEALAVTEWAARALVDATLAVSDH
jgi:hypothetical protein